MPVDMLFLEATFSDVINYEYDRRLLVCIRVKCVPIQCHELGFSNPKAKIKNIEVK